MGDRFGRFTTLGVRDGEHVERVIVVRILVADQPQVEERLVVVAAVDRERRRIEALVDRLRRGLPRQHLTLADVQVEADALVQLLSSGYCRSTELKRLAARSYS